VGTHCNPPVILHGYEQLEPLFDHLADGKNVEMLLWGMNQGDAVRVDQELKDALNWPMNLDPVTKTTKTCRYVEAAFLWRVETTTSSTTSSTTDPHAQDKKAGLPVCHNRTLSTLHALIG
jgi:hypothetical protein